MEVKRMAYNMKVLCESSRLFRQSQLKMFEKNCQLRALLKDSCTK